MGFYPQPNAWQCGPFALKHALLTLGVVAHERSLTRASGTSRDGADEQALARAAERWRCELPTVRRRDLTAARTSLVACLARRQPVLLCVDQWNHWITVVGHEGDHFVVTDSREPGVFRVDPWPSLSYAWGYRTQRGARLYDLHPLVAESGARAWGRFSPDRAAYLRRAANRDLTGQWSRYLLVLLAVSQPRVAEPEFTVPLADVLRRQRTVLLQRAVDGGAPADAVRRRLRHACFVAETHALQVAPDGETLALATVEALAAVC